MKGSRVVTLNDAEQIIDSLSAKAIKIEKTHCVCVRNRNASCNHCSNVCPTSSIEVKNNCLTINPDTCIQCGSCANACPTQAISSAALPHESWLNIARSLPDHSTIWICCEEHPLAQEHLSHLVTLPCLAHLDEVHLLIMAHYNIKLILLHNSCESCAKAQAKTLIDKTLQSAQRFADTWNISLDIKQKEETSKEESCYPLQHDKGGYSRRGFFGSLGESIKHLGYSIAESAFESAFPDQSPAPTLAHELTQAPGKLIVFMPLRNTLLLNILFEEQQANPPQKQTIIETRFWGQVTIDNSCTNCGMCARFCPTQALIHLGEEPTSFVFGKHNPPGPDHGFRCSDCIQCRLCEDICPTKALHVHGRISSTVLFDLEPVVLKRHDE